MQKIFGNKPKKDLDRKLDSIIDKLIKDLSEDLKKSEDGKINDNTLHLHKKMFIQNVHLACKDIIHSNRVNIKDNQSFYKKGFDKNLKKDFEALYKYLKANQKNNSIPMRLRRGLKNSALSLSFGALAAGVGAFGSLAAIDIIGIFVEHIKLGNGAEAVKKAFSDLPNKWGNDVMSFFNEYIKAPIDFLKGVDPQKLNLAPNVTLDDLRSININGGQIIDKVNITPEHLQGVAEHAKDGMIDNLVPLVIALATVVCLVVGLTQGPKLFKLESEKKLEGIKEKIDDVKTEMKGDSNNLYNAYCTQYALGLQ